MVKTIDNRPKRPGTAGRKRRSLGGNNRHCEEDEIYWTSLDGRNVWNDTGRDTAAGRKISPDEKPDAAEQQPVSSTPKNQQQHDDDPLEELVAKDAPETAKKAAAVEQTTDKSAAYQQQIDSLQEQLQQRDSEVASLKSQLQSLQQESKPDDSSSRQELEQQLVTLKSQLQSLQKEGKDNASLRQELEQQLVTLKSQWESLQESKDDSSIRQELGQKHQAAVRTKKVETERDNALKNMSLQQHAREMNSLKNTLEARIGGLYRMVQSLQNEAKQHQVVLNSLKEKHEKEKSYILKRCAREVAALKQDLEILRTASAAGKLELEQTLRELHRRTAELQRLGGGVQNQDSNQNNELEFSALRTQLVTLHNQLKAAQQMLRKKDEAIASWEQGLRMSGLLKKHADELRRRGERHDEELRAFKDALNNSHDETVQLNVELRKQEALAKKRQARIEELEKQIERMGQAQLPYESPASPQHVGTAALHAGSSGGSSRSGRSSMVEEVEYNPRSSTNRDDVDRPSKRPHFNVARKPPPAEHHRGADSVADTRLSKIAAVAGSHDRLSMVEETEFSPRGRSNKKAVDNFQKSLDSAKKPSLSEQHRGGGNSSRATTGTSSGNTGAPMRKKKLTYDGVQLQALSMRRRRRKRSLGSTGSSSEKPKAAAANPKKRKMGRIVIDSLDEYSDACDI